MKYRDMTPEQKKAHNASSKRRRTEHREEYNERKRKYNARHREELNRYMRNYHAEHREEHKEYKRKYHAEDTNSTGATKNSIRVASGRILDKIHTKLQGYEIHHCFSYDDPNIFIYIPKTLHTQIHRLLRDNNIPADSDHWNVIRDLVNSCEEYTYIRC